MIITKSILTFYSIFRSLEVDLIIKIISKFWNHKGAVICQPVF